MTRPVLLSAGLTEYIPDTYIVAFTQEAGHANAAAATLVEEVQTALQQQQPQQQQEPAAAIVSPSAASTSAGPGSSDSAAPSGIKLLKTIGQEPAAAPGALEAETPSDSAVPPDAPPTRMQAAVVKASAEALQLIKASPLVKAVVQDQVIIAQPVTCVQQQFVGSGVSTVPRSAFSWPGCYTSRARLMWRGITCSDGSATFCKWPVCIVQYVVVQHCVAVHDVVL
jgi:hypothetical protein